MREEVSVQPAWCRTLPLQQQSVLLLAARGPDGIAKTHPCKKVQRAYRATVLVAAKFNRLLVWGEIGDSFMSLGQFANELVWSFIVQEFFQHVDEEHRPAVRLSAQFGFQNHSMGFGGPPDLCKECILSLMSELNEKAETLL